jgi:hypothetical protein
MRFHAGNFLNEELRGADVLVFGRVLHKWDLTTKRMLLQKAFRALPTDGAVLVYDTLVDDERRSCTTGLLSPLNMLVWTSAGFGYSGTDRADWMHGHAPRAAAR